MYLSLRTTVEELTTLLKDGYKLACSENMLNRIDGVCKEIPVGTFITFQTRKSKKNEKLGNIVFLNFRFDEKYAEGGPEQLAILNNLVKLKGGEYNISASFFSNQFELIPGLLALDFLDEGEMSSSNRTMILLTNLAEFSHGEVVEIK